MPPTTPPTMAPVLLLDPEGAGDAASGSAAPPARVPTRFTWSTPVPQASRPQITPIANGMTAHEDVCWTQA